jgi:hypothetical protein
MENKEENKSEKKEGIFLKLFKKSKSFFSNKESVAEFMEKEKAKAEILIDAAQKMIRQNQANIGVPHDSYHGDDREVYLYDFLQENGGGGRITIGGSGTVGGSFDGDMDGVMAMPVAASGASSNRTTVAIDENIEKIEPRKKIKPIDVWKELEHQPNKISLEDIDDKIMVLNLKKDFIRHNNYAKKEVMDMATRLENRKKYEEHREFFERFDNTDTDKIKALIDKYDLVLKPSDLFIPKFPKEAMMIMKEYNERVNTICGKKPVYYVVAEKSMFKEEEKRNDPILLVQSPFGIYWQVLGAWDKELVLLEEL